MKGCAFLMVKWKSPSTVVAAGLLVLGAIGAAPPASAIRHCAGAPPDSQGLSDQVLALSSFDRTSEDDRHTHFDSSESSPDCGGGGVYGAGIPARLFSAPLRIDLSKFTVKKSDGGLYEARGQAWSIHRDTAGHGGKVWKLKDARSRPRTHASLRSDGSVWVGDKYWYQPR